MTKTVYLCISCYEAVRDNLPLQQSGEIRHLEKNKCELCGKKVYGDLYIVKQKGAQHGL